MYSIEYILFIFKAKERLYTNLENRGRNCVQISNTSSVVFRTMLGYNVAVYDAPFVFVVIVSYHLFFAYFV